MTSYRPFLNGDPPGIAEIWRLQPPSRGLMQPMSAATLDRMVLAKLYFEREGLIVAEDGQRLVGFVHAGFGPNADYSDVAGERGAISMLMVGHCERPQDVADELLRRGEQYLVERGAKQIYAGGVAPVNPFYLGLYGGSELPGVLQSDAGFTALFRRAGYAEQRRIKVLQRDVASFRPVVNRQQMQLRRGWQIEPQRDPPTHSWWEACTVGVTDRTQFLLHNRTGGQPLGRVTYWDMQPLSSSWGVHAAGLTELEIDAPQRRQGLATFLVGESMRQLHAEHITLVETHVDEANEQSLKFFAKLGFTQVDEGVVLVKQL